MGQHPIAFMLQYKLSTKEVKFRLHMKDYKWRIKWIKIRQAANLIAVHLLMGQNPVTIARHFEVGFKYPEACFFH